MTPLDTGLTVAAGATAGAASVASTIGIANLTFSLLSACVAAGVAYGVLKKGAEARDAEVALLRDKIDRILDGQTDIRERLSNIEGWRDGR